jgi:hypothetical protein
MRLLPPKFLFKMRANRNMKDAVRAKSTPQLLD